MDEHDWKEAANHDFYKREGVTHYCAECGSVIMVEKGEVIESGWNKWTG